MTGYPHYPSRDSGRPFSLHVWAALILLGLLAGCATLEFGKPLKVSGLNELSIGQSTVADVRRVLGEPTSKGAARLPADRKLRQIWAYDHFVMTADKANKHMLIIFIRDDRYEGHLWFSSVDEVKWGS